MDQYIQQHRKLLKAHTKKQNKQTKTKQRRHDGAKGKYESNHQTENIIQTRI